MDIKKSAVNMTACVLSWFFLAGLGLAAQVHLAWDPAGGVVDGYRIYYGTTHGIHPVRVEVGNVTQYVVTGLNSQTTYYFVVRAYNNYGESGDSNELSVVASENRGPSINSFKADPNPVDNPLTTVTFTVQASDPDGDALTYTINFGDGSSSTSGNTATHAYSSKKTYTATATVSDGHGHSVDKSIQVTVNDNVPTKVTGVEAQ